MKTGPDWTRVESTAVIGWDPFEPVLGEHSFSEILRNTCYLPQV